MTAKNEMMKEYFTREEFEKFFYNHKDHKIKCGLDEWKDEKSPYDVVKAEEASDGSARNWDDEDYEDDWSDEVDENEDIEEALNRLALREPWRDVRFN